MNDDEFETALERLMRAELGLRPKLAPGTAYYVARPGAPVEVLTTAEIAERVAADKDPAV